MTSILIVFETDPQFWLLYIIYSVFDQHLHNLTLYILLTW